MEDQSNTLKMKRITGLASAMLILALAAWAVTRPNPWMVVAAYSTSLNGRTSSQVHNARLAVKSIDGVILQPRTEFSFNRTVGSWSSDRGYVKAPVSYDGELIPSWGGGVCQVSTTLYNAALLVGIDIIERHRHQFPAHYAPPGRDAAVAQYSVDLRFKNPYDWPVKIESRIEGDRLICRALCRRPLGREIEIEREVRKITAPGEALRMRDTRPEEALRWRVVNHGSPGVQVAVYRRTTINGRSMRTLISEDTYPPMSRLMWAESRRF